MSDRAGSPAVLQKLVSGAWGSAIGAQNVHQVGGLVVEAGDAAPLRTAAEVLAAYGYEAGPSAVDVIRFEAPSLAVLSVHRDEHERPWPTYPAGFLHGASLVPTWSLARTRFTVGAEMWRIEADGRQQLVSVYDGVARGWRGATGWSPPSQLVGPQARWQGRELVADPFGEEIELVRGGQHEPGWDEARPGVWIRRVLRSECELFELVVTATVQGIPVRLLQSDGRQAAVLLLDDDPEAAARLGARSVEAGAFEAVVSHGDLVDLQAVANEARPA